MNNFLWWLEDRIFYDFIIITVIELIYLLYVHLKVKKLLGRDFNILPFMNEDLRVAKFVITGIVVLTLIAGLIKVISGSSFWILVNPLIFLIIYWLLIDKLSSFRFYDKGIILFALNSTSIIGIELILWDSINKLAIDKDINQKLYGFWIYSDKLKAPGKFWVKRKNISEVINLFKNFNIAI